MPRKKTARKKNTGKSLILKFLLIVSVIVGSFLVLISIFVFGFIGVKIQFSNTNNSDGSNTNIIPGLEFVVPEIQSTFLVMGLDEKEGLADVNMVVHLDTARERIDLISIPRDTKVVPDEELTEELAEDGIYLNDVDGRPANTYKLTEFHNLVGPEHAAEYQVKVIEDMLGIKIDYYAEVTIDTFIMLVDAVGGVDMEIRPEGLHYSDPTQDLYIDIDGGMQHLDGAEAEQVVRFRSYPDGDLGRIEVQQQFMQALYNQIVYNSNFIELAPALAELFITSVNTNFTVADMGAYLPYIYEVQNYDFNTYILPVYIEDPFVVVSQPETQILIDEIFYSGETTPEPKLPYSLTSKDCEIIVLNGGDISGYASEVENELRTEGYNVVEIGNYDGVRETQTRIVVSDPAKGYDLVKYFDDAYVTYDLTIPQNQIQIIIGTGEDKY